MLLPTAACDLLEQPKPPPGFQGVVEFEERLLGFELGGRIDSIGVHRGDRVQAGQVLAELDTQLQKVTISARESQAAATESQLDLLKAGSRGEDIRALAAQVRGADSTVKHLEKTLARERSLHEQGVTPQAILDDIESQLQRAQAEEAALRASLSKLRHGARKEEVETVSAQLDAARAAIELENERLARHQLIAKHAGTVLDVQFEEGELASPGAPVVTLADTKHPYADVFVPQQDLAGIRQGSKAELRVDAMKETVAGHVEYIASRTEFTPRFLFSEQERPNLVVRVRVRLDDAKEQLHAGVPAFVTISRGEAQTQARAND